MKNMEKKKQKQKKGSGKHAENIQNKAKAQHT